MAWQHDSGGASNLAHAARLPHVIRKLREALCYNQGTLVDYYYQAASTFRKIDRAFALYEADAATLCERERSELCQAVRQLERDLSEGLLDAIQRHLDFLEEIFAERHEVAPRITLALVHSDSRGSDDERLDCVLDVARRPIRSELTTRHISKNYGLQVVTETGRSWLGNRLDDLLVKGQYWNPRINYEKNTDFVPSDKTSLEDGVWCEMWADYDGAAESARGCYKSTLIVPITLMNTEHKVLESRLNLQPLARAILGFLCFDHVSPSFFRDNPDTDVGYIFADILSQYLLCRSIHLSSAPYRWAHQAVQEWERTGDASA